MSNALARARHAVGFGSNSQVHSAAASAAGTGTAAASSSSTNINSSTTSNKHRDKNTKSPTTIGTGTAIDHDFNTMVSNVERLEDSVDAIKKLCHMYVTHMKTLWSTAYDLSSGFNAIYQSDSQHRASAIVQRMDDVHSNISNAKCQLLEKLMTENVITKIDAYKSSLQDTKKSMKSRTELRQKYEHYYEKLNALRGDKTKVEGKGKSFGSKDSDRLQRNETKFQQAKNEFIVANKAVAKQCWEHWRRRFEVLDPIFAELLKTEAMFISAVNNQFNGMLPELKAVMAMPLRLAHAGLGGDVQRKADDDDDDDNDDDSALPQQQQQRRVEPYGGLGDGYSAESSPQHAAATAAHSKRKSQRAQKDLQSASDKYMADLDINSASVLTSGGRRRENDGAGGGTSSRHHRRTETAGSSTGIGGKSRGGKGGKGKHRASVSSSSSDDSSDSSEDEFDKQIASKPTKRDNKSQRGGGKKGQKDLFDDSFVNALPSSSRPAASGTDLFDVFASGLPNTDMHNNQPAFDPHFGAFNGGGHTPASAPPANGYYSQNPSHALPPQHRAAHSQSGYGQWPASSSNQQPFADFPPQTAPFQAMGNSDPFANNAHTVGTPYGAGGPQFGGNMQQQSRQLALMPATSGLATPGPASPFDDLMEQIEQQNAQQLGVQPLPSTQPQQSPTVAAYDAFGNLQGSGGAPGLSRQPSNTPFSGGAAYQGGSPANNVFDSFDAAPRTNFQPSPTTASSGVMPGQSTYTPQRSTPEHQVHPSATSNFSPTPYQSEQQQQQPQQPPAYSMAPQRSPVPEAVIPPITTQTVNPAVFDSFNWD